MFLQHDNEMLEYLVKMSRGQVKVSVIKGCVAAFLQKGIHRKDICKAELWDLKDMHALRIRFRHGVFQAPAWKTDDKEAWYLNGFQNKRPDRFMKIIEDKMLRIVRRGTQRSPAMKHFIIHHGFPVSDSNSRITRDSHRLIHHSVACH